LPENYLVTGSPGVGKTTVVDKVVSELEERGLAVGGVFCPEIREAGRRRGFQIKDIMDGETKVLAHEEQEGGPKVGRYRVNVGNVDILSDKAIGNALKKSDVILIDEIAPMEVYSQRFKERTWEALDSMKPLFGVVHKRSETGFIGDVKGRSDVVVVEVDRENRDELPGRLVGMLI